jgi:EAL domain-containing protein (putative c-di-GMP-specific phosphodiesterase class I)/GGDEF domain-containing protein
MSLSKQLYIIISFIFFMIFTGNFIISVKNTKEYLELESTTKAQDTATSLGMTLKAFMKDKQDPEIRSIIHAIANRGFYKEIRLEDVNIVITQEAIFSKINQVMEEGWKISSVTIDPKFGKLELIENSNDLAKQLARLENMDQNMVEESTQSQKIQYLFIPSKDFQQGVEIPITFEASNGVQDLKQIVKMKFSNIIAKVVRAEKFDYVPQWFIDLLPLQMQEQKSEISDGWNTSAIIYVSANAGDAYAKLYDQAKGAILYAIVAFLISIIFLVIFLQFILKPLKAIESLAGSIAKGKFEIIKKLPWTTEIKNVSIAMNEMSSKIEGVIKKLNSNLQEMTKKLSEDDLTSLQLRQSFETDIKKMFIEKSSGYVFVLKIGDLAEYARNHSNKEVESFLIKFANALRKVSTSATAYRFYGSEFAMIVQNVDENEAKNIASKLKIEFDKLAMEVSINEIAHAGGTPFNKIGTIDGMLSSALEAYEKAKLIGPNEFFLKDEGDLSRDMDEWKNLVFDIIDNLKFEVGYIGQAYGLTQETQDVLLMEEAFTQAKDKKGDLIPIGTFISIAEQYNKVKDFDKAVIQKVVQHIQTNDIQHSISINLSLDSLFDIGFKNWLKNFILENQTIASQLVFSATAYGLTKDVEKFRFFIEAIHEAGAKIIIKRFETKFIPLDDIKNFNLDYIRLARDYTSDIAKNSTKKGFVESMQELSTLLNIKLMAENVKKDEDFEVVKSLKLYGASR